MHVYFTCITPSNMARSLSVSPSSAPKRAKPHGIPNNTRRLIQPYSCTRRPLRSAVKGANPFTIQCNFDISWSFLFDEFTKKTLHCSPVRTIYRVFGRSKSGYLSVWPKVLHTPLSWNFRLFTKPTEKLTRGKHVLYLTTCKTQLVSF